NPRGEFFVRSKVVATAAAVTLAIVLGLVDYLTGREWAISALYLLPTCFAGWVAGRLPGFAVGALCTGVWFLSDILSWPMYQHPLIPVWNAIMLFVFFFVVVWLLTAFRSSHYHLEQTVERRTAEMRSQVLRIRQVLQDYLRFARMPKSERSVVSLKGFLEEKLNFVQPLLDQKHVDLRSTLDPNLPPVYVDAEQLWEAFLNLIRNALDAMPDGGNLTVSAQRNGAE